MPFDVEIARIRHELTLNAKFRDVRNLTSQREASVAMGKQQAIQLREVADLTLVVTHSPNAQLSLDFEQPVDMRPFTAIDVPTVC
jgi:hypothetical protein